jgi:hypothetical protein
MEQFGDVWGKLKITLGTTLLPDLTKLLDKMTRIIVAVSQWTDKHKTLTKTVLEGIGLMGAALLGLGAPILVLGTLGGPIFQLGKTLINIVSYLTGMGKAAKEVEKVAEATKSVEVATNASTAAFSAWEVGALAAAAYVGYILGDYIYEHYIKNSKFENWLSNTKLIKWAAGTDDDRAVRLKSWHRAAGAARRIPSMHRAADFTSPEALSGATGGSAGPIGGGGVVINYKPVVNVTFGTSTPVDETAIEKMISKALAHHDDVLLDKIDRITAKRARTEYR